MLRSEQRKLSSFEVGLALFLIAMPLYCLHEGPLNKKRKFKHCL